jgi:hypothetical protein
MVGHRTIGLSLSTGRGATAAAFARRARRRVTFFPGCCRGNSCQNQIHKACILQSSLSPISTVEFRLTWSKCVRTRRCQSFRKSADTDQFPIQCHYFGPELLVAEVEGMLTVVGNLLVVLDRLESTRSWLAIVLVLHLIARCRVCDRAVLLTIVPGVCDQKLGVDVEWSSQATIQTVEFRDPSSPIFGGLENPTESS